MNKLLALVTVISSLLSAPAFGHYFWEEKQTYTPNKCTNNCKPPPATYQPQPYPNQNYTRPITTGQPIQNNQINKPKISLGGKLGYNTDNVGHSYTFLGSLPAGNVNAIKKSAKNITSYQMEINGEYVRPLSSHFDIFAEGKLAYGVIDSGTRKISNYNSGVENGLTKLSQAKQTDGHTINVATALGYSHKIPLPQYNTNLKISPLVGLAFREINTDQKTLETIEPSSPTSDSIGGMVHRWYGPFMGVDLKAIYNEVHSLGFRTELHISRYTGKIATSSNSTTTYLNTDTTGLKYSLDYSYSITPKWSTNAGIKYETWWSEPGLLTAEGPAITEATANSKLHEVTLESTLFSLGITRSF